MLKRDYIGRRVRLLRDQETRGGVTFPAGLECRVRGVYRGFKLVYDEACDKCELRFRNEIVGVPYDQVELVEETNGG